MSPAKLEKEINTIKSTAINNGYGSDVMQHIVDQMTSQQFSTLLSSKSYLDNTDSQRFISILFLGNVSCRLQCLLTKKYDYKVTFSTNNNLKKNFVHTLETLVDPFSKSGIYKITCNNCPSLYIGQTGRAIKVWYKEHLLRKTGCNVHNSTFAEHLLVVNHVPKLLEDTVILHREPKGRKLDLWEEYEILKHVNINDGNMLNDQLQLASRQYLEGFKPILF